MNKKFLGNTVLIGSLALLSCQPALAAESKKAKAAAVKKEEKKDLPVLNKWFALGSGCKATPDKPGDVTSELVAQDKATPNTHRIKFHLPKFEMSFPSQQPEKKPGNSFARECSIRLNINPPPGKIIKNVVANTSIVASKSEKVELTTFVGLKLGIAPLGSSTKKYEVGTTFSNQTEDLTLIAGKNPEEVFPELKCGDAKIIAMDFTFMARADTTEKQSASVTLTDPKTVEIVADLADCKQ